MPARRATPKAGVDAVRERARRVGAGHPDLAAELSRMFGMRPREAFRRALGWTLQEAADRFNARGGQSEGGHVKLTASRLYEFERWPVDGRKLPLYVFAGLVAIYGIDLPALLDFEGHKALSFDERAALSQSVAGIAPAGGCLTRPCGAGAANGTLAGARYPPPTARPCR